MLGWVLQPAGSLSYHTLHIASQSCARAITWMLIGDSRFIPRVRCEM